MYLLNLNSVITCLPMRLIQIINIFSDEDLILFLHSCFFRIEPTKTTIDSYFTLRTHSPELFTKRDTEVKSVIDSFNTM